MSILTDRHRRKRLIKALNRTQRNKCYYCKVQMTCTPHPGPYKPTDRTIDHKLPLSRGGAIGGDNVVLACLFCNQRKADLNVDEFVGPGVRPAAGRTPLFPIREIAQ